MKDVATIPQVALRPPSEVMRLARMGSMFPTRLSFLRSLLRRLAQEKASVQRRVWEMCPDGYGHGVYTIEIGGHTYALVAVSSELAPDNRTDRVIATAWDSAFVLYDGMPGPEEIARIVATAPKQEAARFTERDLVLSRANKSVRLFAHVTQALRAGRQPDRQMVHDIGYLMRTTAVYGNGKFGIADRDVVAQRPGLEGPFAAEMLTVWLIRHFTHDLVEHIGGAPLDLDLKRALGIGNATGLGMAPFLVNHPVLLNNWMQVRETALARVRAIERLEPDQQARLDVLVKRATAHLAQWQVPDEAHQQRINRLRQDWSRLRFDFSTLHPIDRAFRASQTESLDVQELAVALFLEPFGALIDGLTECMCDPFGPCAPPLSETETVRAWIETDFAWACAPDYSEPEACAQFWYVSAAKAEPRLGLRFEEPGADLETPLDIGRRIKALYQDLPDVSVPVSTFLAAHPEHGLALDRVALARAYPYGEIQDNLIAKTCLPIDMLRCKLAFFGASKFDPKSDRWTRITLCQGAPVAAEIGEAEDDWWLPVLGA